MNTLTVIADDQNLCGEGPLWDPAGQRLIWNDMTRTLLYDYTPATREKRVIGRDLMIAAAALNKGGTLVVAGATGLYVWKGDKEHSLIADKHGGETLYFNDILADPRGRVYAGTVYWGAKGMEKTGKLYLFEPDGSARVLDEGIELANGLGLSPDNRTLYFTDSAARRVYAYRVDQKTGTLSDKRVFVQVPRGEGLPDGLTVDAQGYVWSAQWWGSQVVRYSPEGKVDRRIEMPVRQVSSVAFGGKEYADLYITSAAENFESELAPPGYDYKATNIGGALYHTVPGVKGKAEFVAGFGK
ncbi:MAG: SMP-30/gluconolactonase/LRE family protein [Planctomycetes bacterium]|nr:SMP-30/gluconolactonase/LRE family protein [Planctomycetota bacterium]